MEEQDFQREKLIAAINKIKSFEERSLIDDRVDGGKCPSKDFKPLKEFCDDFVARYNKSHPDKAKENDESSFYELHEFNKYCEDFLNLLKKQDELHAMKMQAKKNSQILDYKHILSPAVNSHLANELNSVTEKVRNLLKELNQETFQKPAIKEETTESSSFFSNRRKISVACDPLKKKALLCLYGMMERLNDILIVNNKKEDLVNKLESGVFDVTRLKTLVVKLKEIHKYLLTENTVKKTDRN